MTDTPDDLVKRLLKWAADLEKAVPSAVVPVFAREWAQQAADLRALVAHIEALESQELALKAAMEPLVEALELDFGASDDDSESLNGHSMRSTFGQLRRARAALAGDA